MPYVVEVFTGKQDGAGTDANVYMTIYGDSKGKVSKEHKLNSDGKITSRKDGT